MAIPSELLAAAVEKNLPGRTVVNVQDRGVWIRHNYEIRLDGGDLVYLKADRAFPASEKEAYICQLLRDNHLPAPRILAVDTTCSLLPAPFVIQEHAGGERLAYLIDRVGGTDKLGIYQALGRFYRQLHSIHHEHSGWIQGAGDVLPFSPNEYQYTKVIVEIGQRAVERGLLAVDAHRRLMQLWSENMDWLKQHSPSLVTGALPWTIYLARDEDWYVTKVMDLHDFLYWDPAWDLAGIRYPVFREPLAPELWRAFTSAYGVVPSEKRLCLYRLMQQLDAAMGNYLEPSTPAHENWKQSVWQSFDRLLEVHGR